MDYHCNKTYDVYVGHVPKTLPKGKLEQVFSKYGVLVDVLYRFGNGSYGYAIIKFKYQKDADTLLREIDKVTISGYEMELRKGKMNSHSFEESSGATSAVRTVTFCEPALIIPPPMENPHFMEPALYNGNYAPYMPREKTQLPVTVEIMCTSVDDAVTFYGCVMNRYEELRKLTSKLNSICPNLQRLLRKPALNKVYGGLFENMGWFRCSVIQCAVPSRPGMCLVHYIDYGNIAEVSYTDLVELPEPLKNITPFAVKCVFSNLMCNPTSHRGASYLHHLMDQRMSLYALSSWGNNEYQVLKCSCNGIDVITELVRNGFALYKTHMSAISPPLPNTSTRPGNSRTQELHKPKKAGGTKTHNKKTKDARNGNKKVGDACNGSKEFGDAHTTAEKCLPEINNNEEVQNHKGNCKSLSSEEAHEVQDFVPKKLLKRGSDISNRRNPPVLDGAKSVNQLLKVDCVISSLKLVNNIRRVFPLYTDDDLINDAINFLQKEINIIDASASNKAVEDAFQKYCNILNNIKEGWICNKMENCMELKTEKQEQRKELHNELKKYFENFDQSLLEKRKKIQEIITALESNSNAWMNVYLSKPTKTLQDLLAEYNEEKEKKKSNIQKARENTNVKHEQFKKILGDLQREFSLHLVDENTDELSVSTGGKRGSWALKFEESLTELGIALEKESSTSTMVRDRSLVSVIDCILEKLEIPKERIDAECELFEKYKALYDELNNSSDLSADFEELYALQKTIQTMSPNCVCNGDSEKISNALVELHAALLQEDTLLENVSKAAASHFPELVLEHPDLKLSEYQKNSCLLKYSWNKGFFPCFEAWNRIEPSYISKLAEEPVVIKEFKVSSDSEKKALIKKAVTWNEIKSQSLVKIKALFTDKDEEVLYAVLPPVWETLYDRPLSVPVDYRMALNLLQQVLVGLCDIHSRGIAHGAVHPLAILHKDGEVLLDFNFDRTYLQDKFCLNGINFQVPREDDLYKSADMYGFGCLVLWVLFPNLSFSSTDQNVPNLTAFQSIIQDLLSAKDFASLSALLNVNQDLRPSSRVLLSNGFLKDLHILSETVSR